MHETGVLSGRVVLRCFVVYCPLLTCGREDKAVDAVLYHFYNSACNSDAYSSSSSNSSNENNVNASNTDSNVYFIDSCDDTHVPNSIIQLVGFCTAIRTMTHLFSHNSNRLHQHVIRREHSFVCLHCPHEELWLAAEMAMLPASPSSASSSLADAKEVCVTEDMVLLWLRSAAALFDLTYAPGWWAHQLSAFLQAHKDVLPLAVNSSLSDRTVPPSQSQCIVRASGKARSCDVQWQHEQRCVWKRCFHAVYDAHTRFLVHRLIPSLPPSATHAPNTSHTHISWWKSLANSQKKHKRRQKHARQQVASSVCRSSTRLMWEALTDYASMTISCVTQARYHASRQERCAAVVRHCIDALRPGLNDDTNTGKDNNNERASTSNHEKLSQVHFCVLEAHSLACIATSLPSSVMQSRVRHYLRVFGTDTSVWEKQLCNRCPALAWHFAEHLVLRPTLLDSGRMIVVLLTPSTLSAVTAQASRPLTPAQQISSDGVGEDDSNGVGNCNTNTRCVLCNKESVLAEMAQHIGRACEQAIQPSPGSCNRPDHDPNLSFSATPRGDTILTRTLAHHLRAVWWLAYSWRDTQGSSPCVRVSPIPASRVLATAVMADAVRHALVTEMAEELSAAVQSRQEAIHGCTRARCRWRCCGSSVGEQEYGCCWVCVSVMGGWVMGWVFCRAAFSLTLSAKYLRLVCDELARMNLREART